MGKITVETCEIEGLKVITPTVFGDERGYFMETYNYNDYKAAGIDQVFVQDNQSASKKGVLRGLHFQINFPQDKLVRVVSGEVFDVAVDLREGSETYGKWLACAYPQRIRSSSLFPRDLLMDSWCCPITRSSLTSAQTSTIPVTRAVSFGVTRRLVWSGPFRKAWN